MTLQTLATPLCIFPNDINCISVNKHISEHSYFHLCQYVQELLEYPSIWSCSVIHGSWKHVQLRDTVGINCMPTPVYTCKVIQLSIALYTIRIYRLLYFGHKFSAQLSQTCIPNRC